MLLSIDMKQENNKYGQKRVLIMEDDLILTLSLELMLRKAGVEYMERAETGEEAIEKAEKEKIDLIIADIYLGEGISGTEAIKKIQSSKSIPVIYITGNSDEHNRSRAEKTEYIDYLVKPISNDKLRKTLERVWPSDIKTG